MNILKNSLPTQPVTMTLATTLAIALATTLSLATSTASAGVQQDPLTKTVDYAALDVSGKAGAEHLYRRLRAAAEFVCAPADGASLSRKHHYRACVDAALADAIERVDRPLVKNIHDNDKGRTIRLASK